MHFNKFISINERNNTGILGQNPQPLEASRGFWGGSTDAAVFLQLFLKKYAFLSIFSPKFLLKNAFFKCLNKV